MEGSTAEAQRGGGEERTGTGTGTGKKNGKLLWAPGMMDMDMDTAGHANIAKYPAAVVRRVHRERPRRKLQHTLAQGALTRDGGLGGVSYTSFPPSPSHAPSGEWHVSCDTAKGAKSEKGKSKS